MFMADMMMIAVLMVAVSLIVGGYALCIRNNEENSSASLCARRWIGTGLGAFVAAVAVSFLLQPVITEGTRLIVYSVLLFSEIILALVSAHTAEGAVKKKV